MTFSTSDIESAGYETTTAIVITNSEEYVNISMDSMEPDYVTFESLKKTVKNANEEGYYMFITPNIKANTNNI